MIYTENTEFLWLSSGIVTISKYLSHEEVQHWKLKEKITNMMYLKALKVLF